MLWAACCKSTNEHSAGGVPGKAGQRSVLMVLDMTVLSIEAYKVRSVLAVYDKVCVLRCIPLPHSKFVRLEVQLPADIVDEVVHVVIESIPGGEFGALKPCRPTAQEGSTGVFHGF